MIGERALLMIREIDIALNRINEALMRAQPMYSGKISIKFEDEGGELMVPTIHKLRITRDKKFFSVRVPSTFLSERAAWRSSFSINYEVVRALLIEAEYLIKTRKEINIKVRQIKHWEMTFCRTNEEKVKGCYAKAEVLHAKAEDNLRGRPTRQSKIEERERLGIEVFVIGDAKSRMHKKFRSIKPMKRLESITPCPKSGA